VFSYIECVLLHRMCSQKYYAMKAVSLKRCLRHLRYEKDVYLKGMCYEKILI